MPPATMPVDGAPDQPLDRAPGHRLRPPGRGWESPSSTLFAIERALEAGATAIELDVHATADGELVVCHDATVDRTTDGHGRHRRPMTLAELQALDNAYWFIPGADVTPGRPRRTTRYRGRAPEDPDVRDRHPARGARAFPGVVLNLDIKQTAPVVTPYEEALAGLLAEYRAGRRRDRRSFLDPATDAFSAFAPSVADLGRHAGHGRVLAGRPRRHAPRACPPWPSRCPSVRATSWWWTSVRRGGPRGGHGRARVDGERRRSMERLRRPRASTGSSPTCPPPCRACSARGCHLGRACGEVRP